MVLVKTSSLKLFKALGKSFKESMIGGKAKAIKIPKDNFMIKSRTKASRSFNNLKNSLSGRIHRARVKSPESIKNKGISDINDIDDLLGVQKYSKDPFKDASSISKKLTGAKIKRLNRKGYKGVNIKGSFNGIPTEVQLSPGRVSNMGQILQHNAYKPPKGFTDWDIRQADRIGSALVNRIPRKWKKYLEG